MSSWARSSQDQVKQELIKLGQVKFGQHKSGQVKLGQDQVKLGQIKLGQVNSRQVKLGQVKIFPGDICHLSRMTVYLICYLSSFDQILKVVLLTLLQHGLSSKLKIWQIPACSNILSVQLSV